MLATVTFAHERAVTPAARGANRLDVDVALLAGARPGLSDLRLYDAQQRETGYLLVTPQREPRWIGGAMLPIAPTRKTSGFETDLGSLKTIDRVRILGIAAPFLKRVTLEGSGDRTRWTLLADATIFDLPEQELRLNEIAFTPGTYRYLRFVFDDRSSAPVHASSIEAREHDSAARPEPLRFATAYVKRASEPGKSRYRITLPGPRLPITHIEVDVAGGNVFRTAMVKEPRLEQSEVVPRDVGSAKLKRTERDGAVAAEMAVPVSGIEGRELDLEIDDANNPPLNITAIRARLAPQPFIYFESADGAPLVARYGNAAVTAPSYDLEAYRAYVAKRDLPSAKWGVVAEARTEGQADARPAFGSVVEREAFRVSRRVPESKGLTVLLLDAHVLAHSIDLRDLRLVDGEGRQVPYLVEHRPEPLALKLAVPAREATRDGQSLYRIELPYTNLPAARLVLTTNARVFDRNVSLRARRGEVFRTASWRSGEPELPAPALTIDLPDHTPRRLEILIDEGDNEPLPIESVQLLLPAEGLRFTHPGTPLFLLYGNPRMGAPRYDIALLAPRLFAEPAREVAMGAAPTVREADDDRDGRKLFWAGIVVAAVVLIALLLRLVLVRPETSHAPSDTTS